MTQSGHEAFPPLISSPHPDAYSTPRFRISLLVLYVHPRVLHRHSSACADARTATPHVWLARGPQGPGPDRPLWTERGRELGRIGRYCTLAFACDDCYYPTVEERFSCGGSLGGTGIAQERRRMSRGRWRRTSRKTGEGSIEDAGKEARFTKRRI